MRLYYVQRLPVADRVVRARGVKRRRKVDAEEVQHANERRRAATVHSSDDNSGRTRFLGFVRSPRLAARSELALEIHELGQRPTPPDRRPWPPVLEAAGLRPRVGTRPRRRRSPTATALDEVRGVPSTTGTRAARHIGLRNHRSAGSRTGVGASATRPTKG